MAKWSFWVPNWTPGAATSDGASAANPAPSWRGGSATQYIDCLEIKITGLAGASAPTSLRLQRVSSLAASQTALTTPVGHMGALNPFTAALVNPISAWISANPQGVMSTNPTDAALDCGLNAFGGIIRWNAAPTQQFSTYSASASIGEACLAPFSAGSGLVQSHILLEPM